MILIPGGLGGQATPSPEPQSRRSPHRLHAHALVELDLERECARRRGSLDGASAEDVVTLGGFEIEAALTRHKATASLKPIYDPTGEHLRT